MLEERGTERSTRRQKTQREDKTRKVWRSVAQERGESGWVERRRNDQTRKINDGQEDKIKDNERNIERETAKTEEDKVVDFWHIWLNTR